MPNPYAVTSVEARSESESTSVWLAIACGLVGYLAPFAILFPVCWLAYGWQAVHDNFGRVVAIHSTIGIAGLAALIPNFMCSALFAVAGYRRLSFRQLRESKCDALKLGLATLFGYFVVLTTAVWFPLPWKWSAVFSNLVRSGLVAAFPLAVIAYCLIRSRRTRS